ncbi:MAG: hypothetical protein R3C24_00920 [Cyanobacteriota/Melainabacteria group bacterium]
MPPKKAAELTEIQIINRWAWFFVFFFVCIIMIASFGLIAEF